MKKTILFLAFLLMSSTSFAEMQISNDHVSIPLAEINDGQAHYYSIDIDGMEIKFFVLKSRDDVIRAAFDACDVCYHSHKGYSQNGDFMVCNNCGMRFHSTRINVVKGGCNPSPLKRTITGDNLIIQQSDIRSGKKYF